MALLGQLAGITAHRAHQAVASCAVSLPAHSAHCHQPNCALQRTPTPAVLVPCASLRRR
jgi:hypothetical protein